MSGLERLGGDPVHQGNRGETAVEDLMVASLLTQMLKELKIMNIHLAVLTDMNIEKADIDE